MVQWVNDLLALLVLLLLNSSFWLVAAIVLCFWAAIKQSAVAEVLFVIICIMLIL